MKEKLKCYHGLEEGTGCCDCKEELRKGVELNNELYQAHKAKEQWRIKAK